MANNPLRRAIKSAIEDHSPPTLEFVTITNPDEIKDPAKQRKVRRHARRRNRSVVSSSWKARSIVIDLPEVEPFAAPGDIVNAGPPTAAYGRITLSDPTDPNNSISIPLSLEFLRPIGAGRGLQSLAPFPIESNTRITQLVDFSKDFPNLS